MWSSGYNTCLGAALLVIKIVCDCIVYGSFSSRRKGVRLWYFKDLILFYCNVIRTTLEYSCQLFHRSLPKYLSEEIERIQRRAMRIIFPDLKYSEALVKAGIPTYTPDVKLCPPSYLMTSLTTKNTNWQNVCHPCQHIPNN